MGLRCSFVGHSFFIEPIYHQSLLCLNCAGRWTRDGWLLEKLNAMWQPTGQHLSGRQLVRLAQFWSDYAIVRNRQFSGTEKAALRRLARTDPRALLDQLLQ
jgi:hypothetical protein